MLQEIKKERQKNSHKDNKIKDLNLATDRIEKKRGFVISELREESERLEEEGKNVMKQCKENVVFTWTQTNRS